MITSGSGTVSRPQQVGSERGDAAAGEGGGPGEGDAFVGDGAGEQLVEAVGAFGADEGAGLAAGLAPAVFATGHHPAFVVGGGDGGQVEQAAEGGAQGDTVFALDELEFFERHPGTLEAESVADTFGRKQQGAGKAVAEVFFELGIDVARQAEDQVAELMQGGEAFAGDVVVEPPGENNEGHVADPAAAAVERVGGVEVDDADAVLFEHLDDVRERSVAEFPGFTDGPGEGLGVGGVVGGGLFGRGKGDVGFEMSFEFEVSLDVVFNVRSEGGFLAFAQLALLAEADVADLGAERADEEVQWAFEGGGEGDEAIAGGGGLAGFELADGVGAEFNAGREVAQGQLSRGAGELEAGGDGFGGSHQRS